MPLSVLHILHICLMPVTFKPYLNDRTLTFAR
uniref:Uncharacterized protein n=1 Tax=Anguilla anguilla TaxID=7936 RepID=A0A0E9TBF4_ANGAN